jgi:hypothetical protein
MPDMNRSRLSRLVPKVLPILLGLGLLGECNSNKDGASPPAASGGSVGGGTASAEGGDPGSGGLPGTGGRGTGSGGSSSSGGGASSGGITGSGGTGPDAGCVPNYQCKPAAPNTGDIYADCVARVNQFRACVCLPALPRWNAGEACADQDAQYDSQQNTAHAGFSAKICSAGNAQDECPDWSKATPASVIDRCLQMMFDEGPPPAGTCTGQCYQDHGHYINMTGAKYKNGVACGFFTTASGAIWAVQNFQ